MIFIFINPDFDEQLIKEVDSGVPANKMIKQIENESQNQKALALNDLKYHINDMQYWSKPNLASENDFRHYIEAYDTQMRTIEEYEKLRKQYINNEVSKDCFHNKAEILKTRLETLK